MESPLQIVYRKTSELIPDPNNPRTHSRGQIEQLRASYREFGFTNPILLRPDGMIGAGHGRLEMAKAEGLEEVPTITLHGLSEAQWRAYVIADNQLALNAGWDHILLTSTLQAISGAGFDMASLGFSDAELRRHIAYAGRLTDPDDTPEPPEYPVSRRGDLWLCGSHRILCGDATNADDARRLLDGAGPGLMVTDPPYGVEYNPSWRNTARVSASKRTGKVQNDDRADWREAWELFPGDVAYVWHAGKFTSCVQSSLEASGFEIRAQIIWRKPHLVIGRGNYHWQHEPCWYAVRSGRKASWTGGRSQSTVWDIAGVNMRRHGDEDVEDAPSRHGTQKPVECMRRPIENNSRADDSVYDPFLGSGTTLIAAEQSGRICFGLEIDPKYVDVIVHRWQNFTGEKAILSGIKSTFDEIEAKRVHERHGRQRTTTETNGVTRPRRESRKASLSSE